MPLSLSSHLEQKFKQTWGSVPCRELAAALRATYVGVLSRNDDSAPVTQKNWRGLDRPSRAPRSPSSCDREARNGVWVLS